MRLSRLMRLMRSTRHLSPRPLARGLAVTLALALAGGCASAGAVEDDPVARVIAAETEPGFELPDVAIPYTRFVLDNGLTVVVHEDRKVPVIAVNVWYHIGSKNERPGRTGFAHLFEHLMFQGSENYRGEYFEPLERIGVTDINGTTSRDRTNYFQTVPTPALDVALWMESDRMGHFRGAIDGALLDEQRDVVKNEKRQNYQNRPYGAVWLKLSELSYPSDHPYSWSPIGRMADLDAASLDDVREWFDAYYGAANATIVIAGDISPEEARERVEYFFGHIPAGPAVERPGVWVAPMREHRRFAMSDRVPQARVYRAYNVPEWGTVDLELLRLATDVLSDGKSSRLYQRLVYEDQLATDVAGFVYDGEIGSQLIFLASARDGVPLDEVESALDEEISRFLAEGPSAAEVNRARTKHIASITSRLQRVGGFGGKSDWLAMGQVFANDPGTLSALVDWARSATPTEVGETARAWLSQGSLTIEVHPEPPRTTTEARADRSRLPDPEVKVDLDLPELERATLANGMEVVFARRHDTPVVRVALMVGAGYAHDRHAAPGAISLALDMLEEGTTTRSSLEISQALEDLGASFWQGSSLDTSVVLLESMTATLDPALAIFADLVRNPSFPEAELERLKHLRFAQIQREKVQPSAMASRLLGPLLFGPDHPYGVPWTGSGDEASIAALTRAQLVGLHRRYFSPERVRILAVGDVDPETFVAQLDAHFADWHPTAAAADDAIPAITPAAASRVFLVDRPGATQSYIIAGHVIGTRDEVDPIPAELFNAILGGAFTSRINMNLREEKGWSYGARSAVWTSLGQQVFATFAGVQSDKTAESMAEIQRELTEILSTRPPSPDELDRVADNRALRLPGANETLASLLSSFHEVLKYGLPEDHWDTYAARVRAVTPADLAAIAPKVVDPRRVTWVVVGDRAQIEAPVRALGLGEVQILDADGRPVAE